MQWPVLASILVLQGRVSHREQWDLCSAAANTKGYLLKDHHSCPIFLFFIPAFKTCVPLGRRARKGICVHFLFHLIMIVVGKKLMEDFRVVDLHCPFKW